jgi:hypothetical protein
MKIRNRKKTARVRAQRKIKARRKQERKGSKTRVKGGKGRGHRR